MEKFTKRNKNHINDWHKLSNKAALAKQNAIFLEKLNAKEDASRQVFIDTLFKQAHEVVFSEIDCLSCGNCCKVLKPYFDAEDIERIAAHHNMDFVDFASTYLEINNYGEYRMATKPCAFLGKDNRCSIYHIRPKNCQTYPHTKRNNIAAYKNFIAEHTQVCPAVYGIFERIKSVQKQ